MARYVARRFVFLLPLWLGVSVIVFVLMRLMPGDVAAAMLGGEGVASQAELDSVRHALGLDQPIATQYVTWVRGLLTLHLGQSLYGQKPVAAVIAARIAPTANLAALAVLLSLAIGMPAGVISAVRRNSRLDYVVRVVSILGLALPLFWLGILVSLFLALRYRWSVPLGYALPWQDLGQNLQKMVWPALILGYEQAAQVTRVARATMLDVLGQDYVRTAYSKGLSGRVVLIRHALRNALVPVVTAIGTNFALLLGGVVVLEAVFNIPGIGSLLVTSIERRDYPVVEVLLMGIATAVMMRRRC